MKFVCVWLCICTDLEVQGHTYPMVPSGRVETWVLSSGEILEMPKSASFATLYWSSNTLDGLTSRWITGGFCKPQLDNKSVIDIWRNGLQTENATAVKTPPSSLNGTDKAMAFLTRSSHRKGVEVIQASCYANCNFSPLCCIQCRVSPWNPLHNHQMNNMIDPKP